MRRDIWEAAGWSINQNPNNKPGFRPKDRLNATSGGVGGPVWIPKVYNGRNKTFFYFTSDNDLRPVAPTSILNTVPTSLQTKGDFSQLSQLIYDPLTTQGSGSTATRNPFPGNVIPTNRFSKIAANIIPVIPAPTGAALTNNHAYVNTSQVTDHVWSLKIDHSFSDKNRVSYFQSLDSQLTHAVSDFDGPLGTALGDQYQKPRIFRVNHDYTFSPTVMLHSTYGYSRTVQVWFVPAQGGFASKAGFQGLTGDSDATPVIQFAGADGYTAWGMQQGKVNNGGQNNYTHQADQGLTWIKGRHELKGGMRRLQTYAHDLAGTNGTYVFARNETADPAATGTTGNSFASFLLGMPDSANAAATPVQDANIHYEYYGFYFQDNWKVNSKLTLNLGMRYDLPVNWYAPTMGTVSLTAPNPAANNFPGAYVFAGSGPNRLGVTRFWPTDHSNIGPRAGCAYQVAPKTVLRGGFGIFTKAQQRRLRLHVGRNGSFAQVSDGLNARSRDSGIPKPAGYQPPPS